MTRQGNTYTSLLSGHGLFAAQGSASRFTNALNVLGLAEVCGDKVLLVVEFTPEIALSPIAASMKSLESSRMGTGGAICRFCCTEGGDWVTSVARQPGSIVFEIAE